MELGPVGASARPLPLVCSKTLASKALPESQRGNLIKRSEKVLKQMKTAEQDNRTTVKPLNKVKDL